MKQTLYRYNIPGNQTKLFKLFYPIIIGFEVRNTMRDRQINFGGTDLSNSLSFFVVSKKPNFCYK